MVHLIISGLGIMFSCVLDYLQQVALLGCIYLDDISHRQRVSSREDVLLISSCISFNFYHWRSRRNKRRWSFVHIQMQRPLLTKQNLSVIYKLWGGVGKPVTLIYLSCFVYNTWSWSDWWCHFLPRLSEMLGVDSATTWEDITSIYNRVPVF